MRLLLKVLLIVFFGSGLNCFALTTDYVSAFKPEKKVQTLPEFQRSLNSDLNRTRRGVSGSYINSSIELVNNKADRPSQKPVEI